MNRELLKKKFPTYFPVDKLPEKAIEEEIEVYRACKYGFCSDSFLTTYQEAHKFGVKSKDYDEEYIGTYSMSCFENIEELKSILRKFKNIFNEYKNLVLSKGKTNIECGLILKAKDIGRHSSHVDFWLYENAKPIKYFEVIENER